VFVTTVSASDGSARDDRSLPVVRDRGERYASSLRIVHVVERLPRPRLPGLDVYAAGLPKDAARPPAGALLAQRDVLAADGRRFLRCAARYWAAIFGGANALGTCANTDSPAGPGHAGLARR
jgi:nucleotide-binding universal stress UspA family protein